MFPIICGLCFVAVQARELGRLETAMASKDPMVKLEYILTLDINELAKIKVKI